MSEDAIRNLDDIKVSKVTLGFLASLVGLAAFITWNASSIANRIGELEETVIEMQLNNNGADSQVLARLDNLERQIANIGPLNTEEVEEDILDLEDLVEELAERIDDDISWQIGDLWWRLDVLTQAIESRPWGEEFLRQQFGPSPGW